jgi:predicted TIM-barrel fold metal-dependent hydrolase
MNEEFGSVNIGRRKLLNRGGVAILGLAIPPFVKSYTTDRKFPIRDESQVSAGEGFNRLGYQDMLREAIKYRKIDAHNHVDEHARKAEDIVRSCDRVGIGHAAVSIPNGKTVQEIRENNNIVLKAMKAFPNRILGQCYINPTFKKEAIEEINRCIGEGMVMLGELYNAIKINDPLYYPVIEKCIELRIPLMMHATSTFANWWKGYPRAKPTTASVGEDFVDISRRYPEAMIIHGHIGGGGIWEYVCKTMEDAPNVYIDTSGSVCDEAMIDMAIKYIGVDRLLFATDVNFESGVGKIMGAKLTEEERKKIFIDNFNNLLRKAGNNVD